MITRTLVVALLLVGLAQPAHAQPATIGRWDKSVVQVYSTAPDVWKVKRAIRAWNESPVIHLQLVATPCERCITITEVDIPESVMDYEWAGFNNTFSDAGVILDCDIVLNPRHRYEFSPAVVAHEMGHCLGLNHVRSAWAIMGNFESAGVPRWRDQDRLTRLYGG